MLWAIPALSVANEYVKFSLEDAKKLYVDIEFLKLDNVYKTEQIKILEEEIENYTLLDSEYKNSFAAYESIVKNLNSQILLLDKNYAIVKKQSEDWKIETKKCNEKLAKALITPWYKKWYLWFTGGLVIGVVLN